MADRLRGEIAAACLRGRAAANPSPGEFEPGLDFVAPEPPGRFQDAPQRPDPETAPKSASM